MKKEGVVEMLMTSDGAEGHVRTPFYTGDYSFISLFTFYIKS